MVSDIYVCNDFQTPDRFWLNDGEGLFRELGPTAIRSVSYASMGVDFADLTEMVTLILSLKCSAAHQ